MLNSYFRSWKRGFHYEQCAWQVSGSHSARAEPVTAQGRAEIINRGNEASPLPVTACQLQAGGPPLSCSPRTACASQAAADRRVIAVETSLLSSLAGDAGREVCSAAAAWEAPATASILPRSRSRANTPKDQAGKHWVPHRIEVQVLGSSESCVSQLTRVISTNRFTAQKLLLKLYSQHSQ